MRGLTSGIHRGVAVTSTERGASPRTAHVPFLATSKAVEVGKLGLAMHQPLDLVA
jgi:hypothetical protein